MKQVGNLDEGPLLNGALLEIKIKIAAPTLVLDEDGEIFILDML